MRALILEKLAEIEKTHNVRILYACESGSRAWGFASPDSDWDVRFIYVHPQDWYLSYNVESKRDVIECPIAEDLDCNGWDLRKALGLFARSNGALVEWLGSPIIYKSIGTTAPALRIMSDEAADKKALCYHYRHMAKGNAREYINDELVRLKKYLYVIRPLLAIRYILDGDKIPPVLFSDLVNAVCPAEILDELNYLLEKKKNTPEVGYGDVLPTLNKFIKDELIKYDADFSGQGRPTHQGDVSINDRLNNIFRYALEN